jgi:Sortilin, neurotensin receptor 3,
VTEDCGVNIRGLNSGKNIQEFQFHPLEKTWALAATWTDCQEFGDDPCKIYKELYVTKDLGTSWQFLKEYVYDFSWGITAYANDRGIKRLPSERIFITHDPTATGHQNQQKKTWSPSVNLYYSDDFFKTKKLALNNGNSIIKTDHYMFVAKANKHEKVSIYVSSVLHGFLNFEKSRLPTE